MQLIIIILQYIGKLDVVRAESEESLKEVGIAMCAIDRLLGNDDTTPAGNGGSTVYTKVCNKIF